MIGKVGGLWVDVDANLAPLQTGLAKAEVLSANAGTALSGGLGGAAKSAEKDVAKLEKRIGAAGFSTGRWTNLLGGGAGLSPALLVAGVAATGLAMAGSSVLEISDKWETSQRGLAQAAQAQGVNTEQARQRVERFIDTNRRFIGNQAEVVDSYAALTREGLSQKTVQDDLNLALDLSAIKNVNLADATTLLQQAEMGRGKGLVALGINMKDYPILAESQAQATAKVEKAQLAVTKAQEAYTAAIKAHGPHSAAATKAAEALKIANDNLAVAHSYAAARAKASAEIHDALHKKLDDGRQKTSDLQQATNSLGNSWQDFAHRSGPVLVGALTLALNAVNGLFDGLGRLLQRMSDIARISPGANAFAAANAAAYGAQAVANVARQRNYRQGGGEVSPYGDYVVGERGPELLHMGSQGGTIIPHGAAGQAGPTIPHDAAGQGGPTIIVHVHGSVTTERELAIKLSESIRRLDLGQAPAR